MKHTCVLIALTALVGCTTGTTTLSRDTLPDPLTLEMSVRSKDGRASYYRLNKTGEFFFSGGMIAYARNASPAGRLTDSQRLQLWQLIHDYQLLAASGSLFSGADMVDYQLTLRAGSTRNSIHTVDDRIPGMKELNDLLFGYQGDLRYGQVLRPIEMQLEQKGVIKKEH